MNNLFAAKLLQNLRNKKGNKGFTLIELLVVVIIIGVLAAVALPNLLGQVGKARETEAKNAIGTINRAQQAYHFERRSFSPNLTPANLKAVNVLGVTLTNEYFEVNVTGNSDTEATILAEGNGNNSEGTAIDGNDNGVRGLSGGIFFVDSVYSSGVCQAQLVGNDAAAPTHSGTAGDPIDCGSDDVVN